MDRLRTRGHPYLDVTTRDLTTTAILPCRGGRCSREHPARHRFSRFVDRLDRGTGKVTDVDVLYSCDACGHERVWGSFDPEIFYSRFVH